MVEFAITIPLILITLIAVVGFAWILYSYVCVNSAVREGAHLIISDCYYYKGHRVDVENMVKNSAGMLNADQVIVTFEPSNPENWCKSESVTVSATYTVLLPRITIPYIITEGSATLLGPIQLKAESKMRIP